MRHAKASHKETQQDDKSRELTSQGVRQSRHIGAWFDAQKIRFDLMIGSSATRAEETARLVAEGMSVESPRLLIEDALYEASVRNFLDYVNNIEDGYESVLIVGHNPTISYLAEYLTKGDIGDMSTGSVSIISFNLASWKLVSENTGVLERYVRPDEVAPS